METTQWIYKKFAKAAIKKRIAQMKKEFEKACTNVSKRHVKIILGTDKKLGKRVWHLSLLPVLDCVNCAECMWDCYDIKNVLYQTSVIKARANNSAIHKLDIERYWREAEKEICNKYISHLRINVGGDLNNEDWKYVAQLGRNVPQCQIMLFTKNYNGINIFLDEGNVFPSNVHVLLSAWENVEMKNPHNLPVSHVLYPDGRTTAPDYGAIFCGKNCSECSWFCKGCWNMNNGEHLILKAH